MDVNDRDIKQRLKEWDKRKRKRSRNQAVKGFARGFFGLLIAIPLLIIALYFLSGFLFNQHIAPGAPETETNTAATAAADSPDKSKNPFKYSIEKVEKKTPGTEQKEYRTVIKLQFETILAEYDSTWDELWQTTYDQVDKGKTTYQEGAQRMKSLESSYAKLTERIQALDGKVLSDENRQLLAQVKANMVYATSKRTEAASASEHLFKKQYDHETVHLSDTARIDELVKASDQYMQTALINHARIEKNLGVRD